MTALLRHRRALRARGMVTLTVYPNDGRTFCDDFMVSDQELRRFCWAVLADLDRPAAEQAAAEEGADLRDLTRPGQPRTDAKRPSAGCRAWAPEKLAPPDSARGAALAALAAAPRDGLDSTVLAAAIARSSDPGADVHHVLSNAVRSGLVRRVNPGGSGARALYALTDHGADVWTRALAATSAHPSEQERDAA